MKPNRKNSKLCSMPEIQSNSRKISCSRFLPSPHPLTPLTQQNNFHILRVFPLSSITMWLLFILWIRWSISASPRRMKQVRQAVVVLFVCTCEKVEWASEKLITSFDACSPHLLESRGCSFLVRVRVRIEPCRLAPTSAFSISPLNAVVLVLIRQLPAALESQLALIVAERFNSDLFLGLNVHGTHAVSAMRLQLLSHD